MVEQNERREGHIDIVSRYLVELRDRDGDTLDELLEQAHNAREVSGAEGLTFSAVDSKFPSPLLAQVQD